MKNEGPQSGPGSGSRKQLGAKAEQIAAEYLQGKGYRIMARNWRCRSGELDMIAGHEGRLVFVEVRSRRRTGRFGTPQESVNWRKQKQIRETALVYLQQSGQLEAAVRFDVVAVSFDPDGRLAELTHLPGAF